MAARALALISAIALAACGMTTHNPPEGAAGSNGASATVSGGGALNDVGDPEPDFGGRAPTSAAGGPVAVSAGSPNSSGAAPNQTAAGAASPGGAPSAGGAATAGGAQGGALTEAGATAQGGTAAEAGATAQGGDGGDGCRTFSSAWLASRCDTFIGATADSCPDICSSLACMCQDPYLCLATCVDERSCAACKAAAVVCRLRCADRRANCFAGGCLAASQTCQDLLDRYPGCPVP